MRGCVPRRLRSTLSVPAYAGAGHTAAVPLSLQEEIQRLQLGGGGPMGEDAAAEAGTSRQHAAQRHGKAVRVVDSDDEGDVRQRFTDEYDSEGRVLTD